MSLNRFPSLDIVYDLEYGVWKATALHAALELDVFTIIANGNHTRAAIAAKAGCDQRGMRILLDALCSLKLLRKQKGDYFLTPVSESFLVRGKPAYYGEWCLRTQLAFDTRSRVADGIRTGRVVDIDASSLALVTSGKAISHVHYTRGLWKLNRPGRCGEHWG
jgi:hypothetical protein